MTYVAAEARRELLADVAGAVETLGSALADLGAAYDGLDEATGDRLEAELFRPVQLAYGRGQRLHAGFAERHGVPTLPFPATPDPGAHRGVREFVADAVDAIGRADAALSELQDSMMPVEVGDAELRADLGDLRRRLAPLPHQARELLRVLGR